MSCRFCLLNICEKWVVSFGGLLGSVTKKLLVHTLS